MQMRWPGSTYKGFGKPKEVVKCPPGEIGENISTPTPAGTKVFQVWSLGQQHKRPQEFVRQRFMHKYGDCGGTGFTSLSYQE